MGKTVVIGFARTCQSAASTVIVALGLLVAACGGNAADPATAVAPATTVAPVTPSIAPTLSVELMDTDLADEPISRPSGITLEPDATVAQIDSLPTHPPSRLFADPNQPAYDPDEGFAPDARRILDLMSLQFSLVGYWMDHGGYPATLHDLFPDFSPLDEHDQPLEALPLDPVTQQEYAYEAGQDGQTFRLSATMDNGVVYTLTEP